MKSNFDAGKVLKELTSYVESKNQLDFYIGNQEKLKSEIKDLLKEYLMLIVSDDFISRLSIWVESSDPENCQKYSVIQSIVLSIIEDLNEEQEQPKEEDEKKEGEENKDEQEQTQSSESDEEEDEDEEDDEDENGANSWMKLAKKSLDPLKEHSFVVEMEERKNAIIQKNERLKEVVNFRSKAKSLFKAGITWIKAKILAITSFLQIENLWKLILRKIILRFKLTRFIYKAITTLLYYFLSTLISSYALYKIVKNPKRLLKVIGIGDEDND